MFLFHSEVKAEGVLLERLRTQTALIEEAVFAWLQSLGEGYLEGVVVDLVNLEVDDVTIGGIGALEAQYAV